MTQFDFERLQTRERMGLPRPVLLIGFFIVFFAMLLVWVIRKTPTSEAVSPVTPVTADAAAEGLPAGWEAPSTADAPGGVEPAGIEPEGAAGAGEGILSVRGEGQKIIPPKFLAGSRPAIPAEILQEDGLSRPRIYLKVGKGGEVVGLNVVSSSGSAELDRLVMTGLLQCRFKPATSNGKAVEYAAVLIYDPWSAGDSAAVADRR